MSPALANGQIDGHVLIRQTNTRALQWFLRRGWSVAHFEPDHCEVCAALPIEEPDTVLCLGKCAGLASLEKDLDLPPQPHPHYLDLLSFFGVSHGAVVGIVPPGMQVRAEAAAKGFADRCASIAGAWRKGEA